MSVLGYNETKTTELSEEEAIKVAAFGLDRLHLWEIGHPYYGPDHCWYATGPQVSEDNQEFDTWAEFATDETYFVSDPDYNLLYRWDWKRPDPDDWAWEVEHDRDFVMPTDYLQLFFMQQRKGKMVYLQVGVTEADEPGVRAFLRERAEHMARVWAPFFEVAS